MNKIFKVVWNRTIQSFVVTSELAKGRVKSSAEQNSTDVSAESGKNGIATVFRLTVISATLFGVSNAYAATAGRGQIAVDPSTSATAVSGATATGIGALSIGASASATANGAVAVGTSANATQNNSLAVGTNAKATQNHAVAMGADTSASSSHATAIGKSANAVSTDSTALGADSKANGTQATAVGKNALADNINTTALGNSAQAYGIGSMALGQSSTSRGQNGIAIGSSSQAAANAQNAIAIGTNAVGYQSETIAIGSSTQAQTANTIAIGKGAVAASPSSGNAPSSAIALGADANATGYGTIAIGRASGAFSQNMMGLTTGHNNIAIGNTARVGDPSSPKITQSIAIGSGNRVNDGQGRPEGAWAKGDQSIAVGGNVLANGNSSIAIGGDDLDLVGSTRYSGNATDKFIKYNEKGVKTGEYALSGKGLRDIYKEMTGDTMNNGSYGNTISGQGSVALGVQSNSSADLSLAIGTKSQATAFGGVALGTGAKATLLNSVALGTASKTDKEGRAYVQREIMGVTYTWAGGATTDAGDVVSVGSQGYERQIINVAPGDISATSTDAINGSQLYGVLNAIERVRYFSVKSTDGSTDGTKNWNNDGAKGANSIAIGPSASTTSAATNGVAIGNQANVTGVNAVALGNGTTASVQDSVALGNGAVGAANNFDATAKNASFKNDSGAATNVSYAASSSSKIGAVSVGSAGNERQIQNVAAGRISATSTDAVNGSQLYTVMNNVGHNIQQNGTDKSRINNDGTVNYADGNLTTVAITDGENASKVQINVTQGSLSVDNNGTVSAPTAGVATAGDVANAINNAKTTTKVEAGSNTHVNKTTSGKETTYTVSADKATVQVSNALNLTSNTTTAADGAVTTDYSIDLAQSTKDNIQKGVDAKTTVDTKGLTFNGDSGSTNVEKLGSTVTVAGDENITTEAQGDTVTVKLNKDLVVDSVKAGDTTVNNDGVKVGDDVALTQDGVKAGDVKLTKDGLNNAGNKVTNVADGDLNANSKDAVNGSQLFVTNQNVANNAANIAKGINFGGTTGSNNYALGDTINVKGDSNIISETVAGGAQLKLAKDITVDSVTAGDSKLNSDGLTITGGPSVTKSGINAAGNKITNVAAGTDDTDAVNYSQLKQQSAAARTEVAAGTNIKDVVKTTGANGQDVYTVNAKGTTASAGSDKVTVTASAADANNVTDYSIDLAQDTKDDIQKGVDAKTTVDSKGLTFNGDSGSTNVEKLGSTVTVAGDDNITTEAQGDTVTVKLNKDLVVDSVKAGDTTVNNDGVKVAGGPSLTKSGIDAAGNKVTNVADGDLNANSKDAVNGSQLFATNQNVANNAANIAKGLNIAADNGSDDNVQLGETVAYRSSDRNIVTTVSDNQIDFKLAKDITVDSVTAGDSKLNSDGLNITGGPSVTKSGINAAGNKITNVAAGTDDTDAVNYSQLKQQSAAARTEVAAGTNIKDVVKTTGANGQDVYTVNAKGTTASAGSDKVTVTASAADANNVTDYSIDLAQDTKDDIQKGVDAKTTVDTKGLTFNGDSGSTNIEKLGSTVTVAGGDNITTEAQDDKVTVKLKKDLIVDSVKAGDTTVNNDGVKVGDDVALTQDGVKAGDVKLTKDGLNNAGNKVTNVAAGDLNANSKDAVNGSQLFATNQNVANNAANIAKGINFGGTTGSNNYALGDTINVKGDSNIISETVAGGAQLKLADVLNVGQAAPVKIDGNKGEVSGLSNTTLGGSDFAQSKRAATEEQLNAAQDQLVNVLGGNAANNGGNISMTDIGGTGENNIHDAIKAVNATANLPLTFGGDSGKDVERKPGTKLNIVGGQTDAAKLSDGNIGVVANGSDKLEVKLAKDLAVDSVKAGDTTVNTDGVKVGDVNLTKAGLNNGGNKITNVAAGTDDTDAVNVAQLNKAAAAAKTEVVQGDNIVVTQDVGANGQTIYKVATDKNLKVDSVTAGDTVMNNDGVKVGDDVALNKDGLKAGDVNLTKAGLNNGGNKITNVAAGTDDTDAVNVSQLKQAAAASKTEVVQGKNIVVTQKTGDKGQTVYEVATDKDLDVDSVKAGDTTVNTDGVKVGDDVALNKDGLKAGKVNLTKDGLDNAGNKVTNVADGDLNANSKDAVNGSQLYATNQNVANNAATIAKGINFGGTTGSNNYALGSTINVKGDSNIISETVTGGAQLKLADEISVKTVNADTFKAGDTVMNKDGVKVGDKVALNKDGLTAGNTVVNNDGVTIAAPTENNPNNQVKLSPVGLNNGGQRITNVAPGKDGTDAANVNQLIGLGTELQNNINQVGKKAYAGVAGAIAQGSIPQVTRPGATGIGVGSGYYGGQSAMAIGVSAMSDGGNWIVKGNFSANTDGHVGVGAGALYQW